MSLERFVKEEIEQALTAQHRHHEQEFQALERAMSREVSALERTYASEIDRAIESQVNLQAFQDKKSVSFDTAHSLNQQIDTLYRELLPEIIASDFGQQQVQKFLSKADASTTFVVTGEHSEMLTNLLAEKSLTTVEHEESSHLGSITYTTGATTVEFSLEDLLQAVKARTLAQVITCI